MTFKIFVGNLSWNATEEALRQLFAEFGEVASVRIVTDPYTGRSKGFGFVEMGDENSCSQSIEKLDNYAFLGRPLRVSRARQESERTGGGGGGRPPRGPSSGGRPRSSGNGGNHSGAGARRSSYSDSGYMN
jgi:RNA recognition motif-containing protein